MELKLSAYEELRGIEDADVRYERFCDMFEDDMASLAQKMKETIKEKGFRKLDVAHAIDISPAVITRITNNKLTIHPDTLADICDKVLHIECHEFLTGVQAITIIPRKFSYAARCVEGMSFYEKRKLADAVAQVRMDYEAEHGEYIIPHMELVAKRIKEHATEIFEPVESCLLDYNCVATKMALRNMDSNTRPHQIKTLLYFAIAMGTTIDYLIIQDYTRCSRIGYRYGTRAVEIDEQVIIRIIRELLRMPDDLQTKTLARVLKAATKGMKNF